METHHPSNGAFRVTMSDSTEYSEGGPAMWDFDRNGTQPVPNVAMHIYAQICRAPGLTPKAP